MKKQVAEIDTQYDIILYKVQDARTKYAAYKFTCMKKWEAMQGNDTHSLQDDILCRRKMGKRHPGGGPRASTLCAMSYFIPF